MKGHPGRTPLYPRIAGKDQLWLTGRQGPLGAAAVEPLGILLVPKRLPGDAGGRRGLLAAMQRERKEPAVQPRAARPGEKFLPLAVSPAPATDKAEHHT